MWLARLVVERAIAVVYAIGFVVAARQFRPLLGERGLLPAPRFIAAVPFRRSPSLFHLRYSDRLLAVVAWGGAALAVAMVAGLPEAGPLWLTMAAWLVLWLLYLSIVNVGQVFYGFGWESLLLEAGFLAVFLGSNSTAPPAAVLWLFRWLLFRVELGAGLIKLRGDPCWRDLTCLRYHHETQPLPNPLSWRFHHLPMPLHKVEVLANHGAQLVVPFLLFAPQPVASAAAAAVIVTQGWLVLSGNFAWLNALTMTLAFAAIDDRRLRLVLPLAHPAHGARPGWYAALGAALVVLVAVRSWRPVNNLLGRGGRQLMNASFDPLHLVNTYGAFGSITRHRDEIVLEGSADGEVWLEYEFPAKPGSPSRRPPQVAPYHLRLDWLMWFAAMSSPQRHPWFGALVARLLRNDRATLRLLRHNPFPDRPPAVVRARLYRYRFTTAEERRQTGDWWHRTLLGDYLPPVSLPP
jgi:Lipase maturation factor